MKIEKLQKAYISQLLDLYKMLVPFENTVEKSQEIYEEILKDENYCIFVAKENGELLGSAMTICCKSLATSGKNFLVIEDVIVKEGLRGKGIGKKLFAAIDEHALKNNCMYSILVSSDFRKGAHAFYEKMGFADGVRGFRKIYE